MIKTIKDIIISRSVAWLMIAGGIMVHYEIMPKTRGCDEYCIWFGSFAFIFIELIRVDWNFLLENKNDIFNNPPFIPMSQAMGNMIISAGIVLFVLNQFSIIDFPLLGSIFLWTIGGYISQKFERQTNEPPAD